MREQSFVVPTDHPAFEGHFPGRPILPGVVLLGRAVRALGELLGEPPSAYEIASAKFLRPVAPGATLRIHIGQTGERWRFDIVDGAAAVATGVLKVREE